MSLFSLFASFLFGQSLFVCGGESGFIFCARTCLKLEGEKDILAN